MIDSRLIKCDGCGLVLDERLCVVREERFCYKLKGGVRVKWKLISYCRDCMAMAGDGKLRFIFKCRMCWRGPFYSERCVRVLFDCGMKHSVCLNCSKGMPVIVKHSEYSVGHRKRVDWCGFDYSKVK